MAQDEAEEKKFRRNYRACLNCRVRKVKCDLGPVESPREGKCARCLRERKDCVFVDLKRGGAQNVALGKRKREERRDSQEVKRQDRSQSFYGKDDQYSGKEKEGYDQHYYEYPGYSRSHSPAYYSPGKEGDKNGEEATIHGEDGTDEKDGKEHGNVLEPGDVYGTNGSYGKDHRKVENGNGVYGNIYKDHGKVKDHTLLQRGSVEHRNLLQQRNLLQGNAYGKDAYGEKPFISQLPRSSSTSSSNSGHGSSLRDLPLSTSSFSSVEGALVFLAKAAGKIARDDERDHIDARAKHDLIEQSAEHTGSTPVPGRRSMPAIENGYTVRPRATTKLSSIDYIGPNGILQEDEAKMLINYFFSTMHPFFPHIPTFLHSPSVLAGYPILLCAILTIALRYHLLESGGASKSGVPRNIEVHDRLWLYVQRLISQTVWAEASTRSIGTIFAFLLFTEWNPRAIHWRWSDYANRAEEGRSDTSGDGDDGAGEHNLAGLGALRRSYRMAWMLIGSAVRLAQDMGFMEMSAKTFLATHIAEINSVMNISRRLMLAHSLSDVDLDEPEIPEDEVGDGADDDDRIMRMSEDELKAHAAQHVLKFTLVQKAQIELLQIMSLGHESLYGYKAQLGNLSQRQNLSVLNIISPLINSWGRKFKLLLVPLPAKLLRTNIQQHWGNPRSKVCKEVSEALSRESLIFEFNYAKLYVYSLALSPSSTEQKKRALKLDEIRRSAKYIEQAFNAANDMLHVAHRVHKIKILRFMPVRWLTRIVRAVAFIVKCYLTITAHKKSSTTSELIDDFDLTVLSLLLISVDDIVQSIQRAAITLRDCSPDELHLCTRYSNVLLYLCSEMKTKLRGMHDDDDVVDERETEKEHKEDVVVPDLMEWEDRAPVVGDSEVMEWFASNRNIGLDFVGPWTEMIEQQLNMNDVNL